MAAPEKKSHGVQGMGVDGPGSEQAVSRRRLMQNSALTAGALALASRIDFREALAQDAAGTPPPQPSAGRMLDFDFPGLEIGVAAYPDIPTGCTVVNFDVDRFPADVMLELDARGGATWQLGAYDTVNAISLAGGRSMASRPPPAWPPSSLRRGDTGIWSPSREPSFTTCP